MARSSAALKGKFVMVLFLVEVTVLMAEEAEDTEVALLFPPLNMVSPMSSLPKTTQELHGAPDGLFKSPNATRR